MYESQVTPISLTLVLAAGISVLSLTPDSPYPGDSAFGWLVHATPTMLQKSMHICTYALFAASLLWTFRPIDSRVIRFATAFIVAVGFGALMEWLQIYVPGRFGSIYDVMLNAVGVFIGLAIASVRLGPRRPRQSAHRRAVRSGARE
jgi:VanZ like family